MTPPAVEDALADEAVVTEVALGGEDALYVTPTRTLVYRGDGILSEEAVDEFPHAADRLTMSAGRRKARINLTYPLEGERSFTVPASKTDDVLHPVLAGVLSGNDVTEPGESVVDTFRFSELTLVITSDRLVKHVGTAVWDGDFSAYRYDDVEALSFEPGDVATQVVLTVAGRQQRIKAPNDAVDALRAQLERAICAHHDVDSIAALNADRVADETVRSDPAGAFESAVDPLTTGTPESDRYEDDADTAPTPSAPAPDPDSEIDQVALREFLDSLEQGIEQQRRSLDEYQAIIDDLRASLED